MQFAFSTTNTFDISCHVQCTSDAVQGNALDNPAYESVPVRGSAEQTLADHERVDSHHVLPSANFANPLYGMPEDQQELETAQHTQPHSEHIQSHVYENVSNLSKPKHVQYKQGLQVDDGENVYSDTEFHGSERINSPPAVGFHNILYEATDVSSS